MSKEAMWKLKGQLLSLGTRYYDLRIDNCDHVFTRRLMRECEIKWPVCQFCGKENKFPLKVKFEDDRYILRCTKCKGTIFEQEGGENGKEGSSNLG